MQQILDTYKKLYPQLVIFESKGKKQLRALQIARIIAYLLALLIAWRFNLISAHILYSGIVLLTVVGIVETIFTFLKNKIYLSFEKSSKNLILPALITHFQHTDLKYEQDHHVPYKYFQESHLSNLDCSEFGGSNYLEGNVSDNQFIYSDINIYKDKGGNIISIADNYYIPKPNPQSTTRKDVFLSGSFLVIQTAHFHNGASFILEDKSEKYYGAIARFFQRLQKRRGKLLHFPHLPDFENHFKVYSITPEVSKPMLDDEFLKTLLAFKKKIGTPVNLSFNGDHIYLFIEKKQNNFQFNLKNKTNTSEQIFTKNYQHLEELLNLVEFLGEQINEHKEKHN